jgi:hypothetical protein
VNDLPAIRASDADRDAAVALLREQLAEGRLTLGEFTERMSTAYGATTTAELERLAHDMPAAAAPSRRSPRQFLLSIFGSVERVRVFALSLFAGVDVWRVPPAWTKRALGEIVKGIGEGEHRELAS